MARLRAIQAAGDVTKQSSPARQLVPPRADVTSMRAVRTNAIRSLLSALLRFRLSALLGALLAPLAGLCAIAGLTAGDVLAADESRPPLAIQFSLDRPIDAAAAPFVMATARAIAKPNHAVLPCIARSADERRAATRTELLERTVMPVFERNMGTISGAAAYCPEVRSVPR